MNESLDDQHVHDASDLGSRMAQDVMHTHQPSKNALQPPRILRATTQDMIILGEELGRSGGGPIEGGEKPMTCTEIGRA
jgi:hypothetical protein